MITRHLRIHEKGGAHASAGTSGVSGAQSPQPAASGTLSPSPTRFAEFSALPSQAPAAFQFFQGAGSTQAAALPAGGASGARGGGGGGDELESAYSASGSGAAAPPTQPRFLPLVAPFQPEHSSADEAMEATLQVPSSRDSLLCSPQSPRSLHSASALSPLSSPRFGAPAPKCSVDSACDCAPPLPSQDAALLAEAGIGAGAVATCASSLSAGGRSTGSTAEAERPSPEASELFASTNSTGGSSSVPTFTRKSPTPL